MIKQVKMTSMIRMIEPQKQDFTAAKIEHDVNGQTQKYQWYGGFNHVLSTNLGDTTSNWGCLPRWGLVLYGVGRALQRRVAPDRGREIQLSFDDLTICFTICHLGSQKDESVDDFLNSLKDRIPDSRCTEV